MKRICFALLAFSLGAGAMLAQQSGGGVQVRGGVVIGPTGAPPPPVISGLGCSGETDAQFTATFNTDVSAACSVNRGTVMGGPYPDACGSDGGGTVHGINCTGLAASTTYFWKATCGVTVSAEHSCTTTGGGGASPPIGLLNDTTTQTPTYLDSWSTTQPCLAGLGSACTPTVAISNISRAVGGAVTVDTASPHGLIDGSNVTITGTVAGLLKQDVTISSGSRVGTTCTLTVPAGHNLVAGDLINVEGATSGSANPDRWNGPYLVDSAGATTVVYTCSNNGTGGGVSPTSITGGTIRYGVTVTKVDADTFTYTDLTTGALSDTAGTVGAMKRLRPQVGDCYTDTIHGGAEVCMLYKRQDNPGTSNFAAHFYTSMPPVTPDGVKLLMIGSQYFSVTRATAANLFLFGSQATNMELAAHDSNTGYRTNPSNARILQTCNLTTGACSTEHDFTGDGLSNVRIGGPQTAGEGSIILNSAGTGSWIPLYAEDSGGNIYGVVWDTTTGAVCSQGNFGTATGNMDHLRVFAGDTDCNVMVRWSTSGPTSCSMSDSGTTVTFTCTSGNIGPLTVGSFFRTFRGSAIDANRDYTAATVTGGPACSGGTPCVITATDAAVTSASGTGYAIGTAFRGMTYWTNSAGTLVINNNFEPIGSHNDQGREGATNYIVMTKNSSNGMNTGQCVIGPTRINVAASNFTDGSARYAEAQICIIGFDTSGGSYLPGFDGGGGSAVSVDSATGFTLIAPQCDAKPQGKSESALSATWFSANIIYCFEVMLVQTHGVTPGTAAPNIYRVATIHTRPAVGYWQGSRAWMRTVNGETIVVLDMDFADNGGGSLTSTMIIYPCGQGNTCTN